MQAVLSIYVRWLRLSPSALYDGILGGVMACGLPRNCTEWQGTWPVNLQHAGRWAEMLLLCIFGCSLPARAGTGTIRSLGDLLPSDAGGDHGR
jgi:hypothetical protein